MKTEKTRSEVELDRLDILHRQALASPFRLTKTVPTSVLFKVRPILSKLVKWGYLDPMNSFDEAYLDALNEGRRSILDKYYKKGL